MPEAPGEPPRPCSVLCLIDSLGQGGAERSLVEMAPHLRAHEVRLVVGVLRPGRGFDDELVEGGTPLVSLAGGGGRLGHLRRAHALVEKLRPDVVHTVLFESDVIGRIAARVAGVRSVSSIVSVAYGPVQAREPGVGRVKSEAVRRVDQATARLPRRFHAVSATVADDAARQLRVPRSRFDVVARGRDPVRLGRRTAERRHAARERLGVGPDEILLLAVARHEHQKGLDVLLRSLPDVLAALPNARVLVAGRQGRQTGLLHDLANQLNLTEHVSFLGFRSDVPELLCAADLLIVPSRWEGMSGAVLEAMALELPVVASDLSPLREVVGDPEAVLVPPDRPDLLAVAIAGAVAENEGDGTARRVAAAHDLFRRRYTAEHGGGNGELLPAGHRDVTPAS